MNILQFRELKAQEATQAGQTQVQTPVVENKTEVKTETPVTETKTTESTPAVPEKINIEGIGEVTIDELKNGYLRQSDYTQKTQDVARQRKEAEEAISVYQKLRQNPELAIQVAQSVQAPNLDPTTAKVNELQDKVYDLMLDKEISELQHKYSDFEVMEVLKIAQEKQLSNLEDAYFIAKSKKSVQAPLSVDEIKAQLRQELLKELDAEKNATSTIITSEATPVVADNSPVLSDAEKKVARMMRLSEADYAKWRDAGRR